jgi:hypothetical protein
MGFDTIIRNAKFRILPPQPASPSLMRIKADREARRRHQRVAGYALPKGPDRQRPARLRTAAGSASAFRSDHQANRARGKLDRTVCNKGKLAYECVWQQVDNGGPWMCIFAFDIYDWKDLGRTGVLAVRIPCDSHGMARKLARHGR